MLSFLAFDIQLPMMIIPLAAGYTLDLVFGDPRALPHPIVAFGNTIVWCERLLNKGKHRKAKGCAVGILLPLLTLAGGCAFAWGAWYIHPVVYYIVASLGVFYGLANHSLIQEGGEVIHALEQKGLEAGRERLSWIVGRDTSQLSPQKIYTAVLETMAENLNDGVVAPLFFYALGGFPAMMAYKMVNTLDSMIGYKDARYKNFGFCSARLDDMLNYIPARLTAALMALGNYKKGVFAFIRRYARQHASPNSGYPESAMAGILNCRFGGPNVYHGTLVEKPYIGTNDRKLTIQDYIRAARVNQTASLLMILLVTTVYVLISLLYV